MKRKNLFFASALILFGLATVNSVKAEDSATANASATIVTPISITKVTDLNFGAIVPSGTVGTVIVGNDNSISKTGGVTLISQLGTHSAAAFTVNGAANASFYVTLPNNVTLTKTSSTETMTVNTFYHSATGTLDGTGVEAFNVGATLAVAANQVAGVYTGTFDVTVAYN